VSISGVDTVGNALTGVYTYGDAEGDSEGASTYRWFRDGNPISGATSLTYTLVVADEDASITFEVTPVAATGTPSTGTPVVSPPVGPVAPAPGSAPVAGNVSISGVDTVGNALTGVYTYSDADGDVEGASTFRWLRNDSAIAGATSLTYTLVVADEGASITFEVTPVAATGTPSVGAAAVSTDGMIIAPKPGAAPTATDVTVTGGPCVGDTLWGSYVFADADGDAEAMSTFRWLRDGVPIDGATDSIYVTGIDDGGATITFEVTPAAATGTPKVGTPVESAGTFIEPPTSVEDRLRLAREPLVIELEAINLRGQRILKTIETRGMPVRVTVGKQAQLLGLPPGAYFIRARVMNGPKPSAIWIGRQREIVVR
jgi:adhesin/invasin